MPILSGLAKGEPGLLSTEPGAGLAFKDCKEEQMKEPLGDLHPTDKCGCLGQSSPRPGPCPVWELSPKHLQSLARCSLHTADRQCSWDSNPRFLTFYHLLPQSPTHPAPPSLSRAFPNCLSPPPAPDTPTLLCRVYTTLT